MASRQDTMMNPSIEELLDRAGSKFSLVTLSAMRARQINAYFNQLGEGLGAIVPPQVTSVARKPLSIAFEEIAGDKIILAHTSEAPDESEAAAAVEAVAEADPGGDGNESDGAE
jgi:DNA-directed RNA polymerase subunit omega